MNSHFHRCLYIADSLVNWGVVERTNMPQLLNRSKGDSNPGSLDLESSILPLSYRAPHKKNNEPFTCFALCVESVRLQRCPLVPFLAPTLTHASFVDLWNFWESSTSGSHVSAIQIKSVYNNTKLDVTYETITIIKSTTVRVNFKRVY